MYIRPEYFYKFKGLPNMEKVQQVCEIINDKKIYFPCIDKLNDPAEASAISIEYSYAGASYGRAMGYRDSIEHERLNKFKIMSLTSKWDSYLMWAHYGMDYSGCVLVFSSNNTFSKASPVIYSDDKFELGSDNKFDENGEYDSILQESLLFKLRDWSYENEWRLVKKCDDKYLQFDNEELVAVILGDKLKPRLRAMIKKACAAAKIGCYQVYRDVNERKIYAFPVDKYVKPGLTIHEACEKAKKWVSPKYDSTLFHYLNKKNLKDIDI